MGLFQKLFSKKTSAPTSQNQPTLEQDIRTSAEWVVKALNTSPEGELNVSVKLSDGTLIWPVMRCIKRYQSGSEESIFAYLYALSADIPTLKL